MWCRLLILTIIAICFAMSSFVSFAKDQNPYTVVIDPGHGGKDFGCIGKIANEKTIVLDVGLKLGKILEKEFPEVKTIFTRKDDRFIELNERAAIANRAGANLFISIHVNSIDKRTKGRENVHGASVYTLGLHRNDDNLAVAMRENSVIELEDDYSTNYQGFDPSSSESYIIFELTQNLHFRQSISFANCIQQELINTAGREDKGVRQSGFLVLRATSMPAVLVELDFICNPAAEKFLASEAGREKCARSIADAFSVYLSQGENISTNSSFREVSISQETPGTDVNIDESMEYYSIQILSCDKALPLTSSEFKSYKGVVEYLYNKRHNYIVGQHNTLIEAKKELQKIKKDFKDAFIVKMKGTTRIISNN